MSDRRRVIRPGGNHQNRHSTKENRHVGKSKPSATVAVRDLAAARAFYENVLGLKAEDDEQEMGVVTYRNGDALLFVYVSEHAGTNQATSVTWVVENDIEGLVERLKAKGVVFKHYDMADRRGDLHVAGNTKAAWFKDPDGNIHAIVSG